jgi:hypothetical protein
MRKEDSQGVPLDQSRRQTLEALKNVAQTLRSDPEHGAAVRHFEQITTMIREMELGGYSGWDPLTAAAEELGKLGDWLPVKHLAMRLHKLDVQSPATRNPKATARTRRALTNVERLERQILQAVNYNKFLGAKKVENNVTITLIGLVGWKVPVGAKKMEPKPRRKK